MASDEEHTHAQVGLQPEDRELKRDQDDELFTGRCVERRLDLGTRLELCSYDELRVVDVILGRLELGRQRYGYLNLSRDRRNFKRERAEEYVDAAIYDACDELDRAAESAPQRPTPTLAECKARFEQTYGKGAPFDEPPVDPLPPAPTVSGPHALMDFDDSDEEPTRG